MPSYGVIFHPAFPPDTLIDFARRAEAGGFDELWLWEDSFWAGAFTSAAIVLASTNRIRVGIGIMPATVRNPLFTAMEITTLAALYPGRFLPGFGHGVEGWMKQIGAAPKSSLKALEETIRAVRGLLNGETVTLHGDHVHLEEVKMRLVAPEVPPLYVGAMREKTFQLAGRAADGTILTEMASPAYVHWAKPHIEAGMAEGDRRANNVTVYVHAKVNPDGATAREIIRPVLASRFSWAVPHLQALGILDEAKRVYETLGVEEAARRMPDQWIDDMAAAGTPEQAAESIHRLAAAGADTVVLQPLDGDLACLDEYIRYLMPLLRH